MSDIHLTWCSNTSNASYMYVITSDMQQLLWVTKSQLLLLWTFVFIDKLAGYCFDKNDYFTEINVYMFLSVLLSEDQKSETFLPGLATLKGFLRVKIWLRQVTIKFWFGLR